MAELKSPDISVAIKGIYVASRASIPERSAMWREHRLHGWNIISSWIDEAGEGETDSYEELWSRIDMEIYSCEYFILYAEKNDFPLKGALVEAGIALAYGKPVIVVMDFEVDGVTCRPIGSWIKHPQVNIVKKVQDALDMAIGLTTHSMFGSREFAGHIIRNMDDDIALWAEQLAKDSVACGETEYGPNYSSNKV